MQKVLMATVLTVALMTFGVLLPSKAMAATKTVTGEIVGTFCYLTMGAHGPSHHSCGITCAKSGVPVGIVDSKTGALYVLLPREHASALPGALINKMGYTATVTGEEYAKGGSQFLRVESYQ